MSEEVTMVRTGPDFLREKLKLNHNVTKEMLLDELRFLRSNVDKALKSIDQGEPLDDCLIQNATGITRRIAHYNLNFDILPYLEEEEKGS